MGQNKLYMILLLVLVVVLGFSVFTVDEREKAMKFQLGRVVRSDYQPGIHWKVPFVQDIRKFDSRIQTLDAAPELYLTNEKKNLLVDSYVKWRIADVERFYTAAGGSLRLAASRLHALNQKDMKDAFGKRTIAEVVAGERAEMMRALTISLGRASKHLGLEVIDVRVKRIDLPDDVSTSVYNRMSAERKEVAKKFRSRGEEAAKKIRAVAEREREVLLAEADRKGQQLRGEGDGASAEIYARAYSEDAEFYAFYRSLQAYSSAFKSKSDVLLLKPDSNFFRYFKEPSGEDIGQDR